MSMFPFNNSIGGPEDVLKLEQTTQGELGDIYDYVCISVIGTVSVILAKKESIKVIENGFTLFDGKQTILFKDVKSFEIKDRYLLLSVEEQTFSYGFQSNFTHSEGLRRNDEGINVCDNRVHYIPYHLNRGEIEKSHDIIFAKPKYHIAPRRELLPPKPHFHSSALDDQPLVSLNFGGSHGFPLNYWNDVLIGQSIK